MEIKYDTGDDHAIDISSDHESAAPSQSNSVADHHPSLTAACDSTSNAAAATTTTVHQTSSSESIKHGPSQDQQANDDRKHGQNFNETRSKQASEVCLNIASVFLLLLLIIVVTLIMGSLALVFTCTLIPGIIICLVLAYMITSIVQFCRCDDYADLDDEYDTDLGTYRYELVVWMFRLTGILVGELLLSLALFRIGPFALRRLSLLDVRVWKWFLIGIIVLVYFGFWLLTHIVIHKARDKSSILFREVLHHGAREKKWSINLRVFYKAVTYEGSEKSSIPGGVFFRVHVLPILKGLLGVAVCGFYFLVDFLIIELVPPLRRPRILGLNAHKWIHALVYVFIGLNVSRIISASIVAMLQNKHKHEGKIDYINPDKQARTPPAPGNEGGCKDPSQIPGFLRKGCKVIMSQLFRRFDPKKCTIYIVIGLRRSINFVLVSIWLLVTWISHFQHQLKPTHDTAWILRAGTGTLICLVICAILWLVKNSIMLWWKYRSIYNKFYDQVVEEGIKLYLLGMVCGQHLDVLKVDEEKKKLAEEKIKKRDNYSKDINEGKKKLAEESRRIDRVVAKARRILVPPEKEKKNVDQSMNRTADDKTSYQPGIYAITRMVRYFLRAEDTFKKDINASFEGLRKTWRKAHPAYDQNANSTPLTLSLMEAAYGTELSDDQDFENLLISEIKGDENSEEQLYLQDFERWMERSHKTCFHRVSTLASAQWLARYLNGVMIAVIIFATICIWLTLVTGGTKAVIVFTAPLLALSFIIGDTCATVFKGIIFLYVIHPYDIGDICFIKDTWCEVKQIDFWTTTFLKVKTKEEVSYPNSGLFNDPIINKTKKKGRLDDHDSIEYILESDTNEQNILEKIGGYFKEPSTFQKPHVEVNRDIGDIGKQIVTIHFKHNLNDLRGVSNSKCLQEMMNRKGTLHCNIMKSCPNLKIKPAKEESD